jgi:hypothetical protein
MMSMNYKQWIIGFKKAGGKEYQVRVYAETGPQAVRIVSNKLSGKLGEGEFYIIGEADK